jgi:hypothetical protein
VLGGTNGKPFTLWPPKKWSKPQWSDQFSFGVRLNHVQLSCAIMSLRLPAICFWVMLRVSQVSDNWCVILRHILEGQGFVLLHSFAVGSCALFSIPFGHGIAGALTWSSDGCWQHLAKTPFRYPQ